MRSCRRASSIRISPTPCSTSVCDTGSTHPLRLDDAGNGHDFVTAHDERPAFAVGARDLCVDEHVLDLLGAACEPVARTPPPYLKPWLARLDTPTSPLDRPIEVDRPRLEPQAVRLAHRLHAAAEIDALGGGRRVEQLRERRGKRPPLVEDAQDVLACRGMDALEQRQDLVADQPAQRVVIRGVDAPGEPVLPAERL